MVRSPGWGRAREGHGSEGECPKGKGAVKRAQASRSPAPNSLAPLQNVPFIAVTSFLCLRFISPAILAPKLFHLRERHADARTSRTLLLLAKVRGCGPWREMPSWVLAWGPRGSALGSPLALGTPGGRPPVPSWGTAFHSVHSFLMVARSHGLGEQVHELEGAQGLVSLPVGRIGAF